MNKSLLTIGVILLALIHTFVNNGLLVIMVPILNPFNKFLSYGYLSAGIAATVTLIYYCYFYYATCSTKYYVI